MYRAALCLFLLACGPKTPTATGPMDPAAVLAAARAPLEAAPLRASYGIKISSASGTVATRGSLLLLAPDHFRVDILGGLGTPVVSLICDGAALAVWDGRSSAFYRADDAVGALGVATLGAVKLSDAVALLSGRLPLPDAEQLGAGAADGAVSLLLQPVEGVRAAAVIDGSTALLRALTLTREGQDPAVILEYGPPDKDSPRPLPGSLTAHAPSLGLQVEIDFKSWELLEAAPPAFNTQPPGKLVAQDLIGKLKEMSETAGRPPP